MKRRQKIWIAPHPPNLDKIQKNGSFFSQDTVPYTKCVQRFVSINNSETQSALYFFACWPPSIAIL